MLYAGVVEAKTDVDPIDKIITAQLLRVYTGGIHINSRHDDFLKQSVCAPMEKGEKKKAKSHLFKHPSFF